MDELIPVLGAWFWWVAAGVLLLLELFAPGVFFIWLAIAAAVTSLLDLAFGFSWQGELLVFAAASIVAVFAGKAVMKRRTAHRGDHQYLNRRQQGYVGRSYVLQAPISGGRGKLTIEDTVWEIEGPDLPTGARVSVTGVDGVTLKVVAA